MSSFEPGGALLDATFVPDPGSPAPGRFEGGQQPEPEEAEPAAEAPPDPEQIWLTGYAAGRDAACAELPIHEAAALEAATQALLDAVVRLDSLRREYLSEQRRALVELSLAIAGQILGRELSADVDALAGIVERSLAALPDEAPLTLLVSEADHATLQSAHPSRIAALLDPDRVELGTDPDLSRGEVRVRAGAAEVDGRIPALLALVREGLEDCLATAGDVPHTDPDDRPERA